MISSLLFFTARFVSGTHDVGLVEGMIVCDLSCEDRYLTRPVYELANPGHVYRLSLERNLLAQADVAGAFFRISIYLPVMHSSYHS